jgi:hypothetical protein
MAESGNYSRKNDRCAEEEYSSMEEASSLAAAMRDSSARRDSSLSSAYRESALASASRESLRIHRHHSSNSDSTQQVAFNFPFPTSGSDIFLTTNSVSLYIFLKQGKLKIIYTTSPFKPGLICSSICISNWVFLK